MSHTVCDTYCSAILSCFEPVELGVTGCDWTFSYTVYAILFICPELPQTVPMYTCAVVFKAIGNCDL